jgi:type IV pilus assembly protein PilC
MPVYQYRARTGTGEMITGTYESPDKSDVVIMLRKKGCYPVSIKEQRKKSGDIFFVKYFKKISHRDIAVFCRQFSTMVNAGIPILSGLDILREQIENPALRERVESLYQEVQKGKSMSQVMAVHRDVFPELLINMVEAGEVSGTLDRVMDRMAVNYEKEYKINQKVKNALIYPSLIAVVATLVVIFLVTVVLPTFASMFWQMGATLPLSTRVLMVFSYFIRDWWLLLLTGLIGFLFGIRWYSHTESGRELFDVLRLRIPVMGNVNKKMLTRQVCKNPWVTYV